MKKVILSMLLGLFVVTGCSDNETEPVEPEEEESMAEEENDQERKEEEKEKEDAEETNVVDEEKANPEAQYYIEEDATVVPLHDDVEQDVVLLTFDDAPADYALQIAETLEDLDAGAIFFVNGHFLETPEEEEALKELHDMGFIIGNHTDTHPLLTDISEEEQREEIVNVNDRVEEIIGERPKFFRAPNGMNTDYSEELVRDEGMVLMNWTYGFDYFEPYMDADKLAEAMITGEAPEIDIDYSLLKPGANLLMHDREWTSEALEEIIIGLRESGYEMVDPHLIQELDEGE